MNNLLRICLLCFSIHYCCALETFGDNGENVAFSTVREKLRMAGSNQAELESVLTNDNAPEIEILLLNANQSDLVNLTAQQLLNTVKYTRKAKTAFTWASTGPNKIPKKIWDEYVLPYRVSEEALDDWRPEFFDMLMPIVEKAKNTKEAMLAIHKWLYIGDNGVSKISFSSEANEFRDIAPRKLLFFKRGTCIDMIILEIALLRSVGIPARLVVVPYWMGSNDLYHCWLEYWDTTLTKEDKWTPVEAAKDPNALLVRKIPFPAVYAFPGYLTVRDPVGTENWNSLIEVTEKYTTCSSVILGIDTPDRNLVTYTVYTYNYSSLRSIGQKQAKSNEKITFHLPSTKTAFPYVITAFSGQKIFWKKLNVTGGGTKTIIFANNDQIDHLRLDSPLPQK